ncbi:hypothetical protein MTP04_24160 [Lysinibacillus sp. PLM2]|nr:hypothetical protein MTP04_24160 [Lysinibacillus sp. PLM2]
MICYEDLREDYNVLKLKRKAAAMPSINQKVIKKESELSHFAQMLAFSSGVGLGFLGKKETYSQTMIPVTATGNEEIMNRITTAFDPLIDLIVGLSLPIAGVMLSVGALLIMIGQKEHGYKILINCGLGYVLVNMTPLFMEILKSVGDAI